MNYDTRQLKEIALAMLYAERFAHGTVGHNHLLLIDKLARELDFSILIEQEEIMLYRDGTLLSLEAGDPRN